ncbi:F-box protein At1g52495-like [Papaver somniferum]|uniref:F-box protein At1g52495-like n=1 Tax=Papaver somniferum TaxID=3469 RepID=UPI000E6F6F9D|nr:F-box protein At1g52495-like [Papaver somniferum]
MSMKNFSPEIILEIVPRIPAAEDVLNCKLVCKEWLNVLSSRGTYFANMHIRHQLLQLGDSKDSDNIVSASTNKKINHPPFATEYDAVIAACNGDNHQHVKEPVYIFNPFTSEYVDLPRFKERYGPHNLMRAGFGYLHSKDEYKVVRIFYADKKTAIGHVQVYTFGDGNGWRDKGENILHLLTPSSGVFANGAIHWVDLKNRNLVSFDLKGEAFQNLPLPKITHSQVQVVCVPKSMEDIVVWSLRQKENEAQDIEHSSSTWRQEFKFASRDTGYHPFAMTRSGLVLFSHFGKVFSTYNPKTEAAKCLALRDNVGAKCCRVQAFLHRNSFVSLKGTGEKGTKTRKMISTPSDTKP